MKRFATSVTALALAGAMSLTFVPAASAQSTATSSGYSIESIAGSMAQFYKLSGGLQAEIREALEKGDVLKLVELKARADAELAGQTGANATGNAALNALSSPATAPQTEVRTDGKIERTITGGTNTAGNLGSSAPQTEVRTDGKIERTITGGTNTAGNLGSSVPKVDVPNVDINAVTGSSGTTTNTTTTTNTNRSLNLTAGSSEDGGLNVRTILGITGLTLAGLSFGSMLSSEGGANLGSSSNTTTNAEKKENGGNGGRVGGEVAAGHGGNQGKAGEVAAGHPKKGDVAAGKRGVLAATGNNTAARALAAVLFLLVVGAAGVVVRRKFAS
ncbi:hypothetical protein [Corynebacterium hindlerae]|uniref:hypothetical protein n=1 Tax=Corynebacterium hindlerae TaxID=699041 RepID=UPI003AADCBEA